MAPTTARPAAETTPAPPAKPHDPTDPYEPIATDEDGTADDEGNDGERKEECSGFLGCTLDQLGQVGEGLFVDGIWGDVTDLWDTVVHPIDTVSGIVDYGKSLGDKWSTDSKDAGDKWADGDYFDALTDWGGASVNTGVNVLDDMFVGEEVRETWNRGEETQAATTVIWNVGSLFIPGYDVAKVAGKSSKLGKLGKLAQAIAETADKAKDAAGRARKAAGLGDAKGLVRRPTKRRSTPTTLPRRPRSTAVAPSRWVPPGSCRTRAQALTVSPAACPVPARGSWPQDTPSPPDRSRGRQQKVRGRGGGQRSRRPEGS